MIIKIDNMGIRKVFTYMYYTHLITDLVNRQANRIHALTNYKYLHYGHRNALVFSKIILGTYPTCIITKMDNMIIKLTIWVSIKY